MRLGQTREWRLITTVRTWALQGLEGLHGKVAVRALPPGPGLSHRLLGDRHVPGRGDSTLGWGGEGVGLEPRARRPPSRPPDESTQRSRATHPAPALGSGPARCLPPTAGTLAKPQSPSVQKGMTATSLGMLLGVDGGPGIHQRSGMGRELTVPVLCGCRAGSFPVPHAAVPPETGPTGASDRGSQAGKTVSPPATDTPLPCMAGRRPRGTHFPSMPPSWTLNVRVPPAFLCRSPNSLCDGILKGHRVR